MAPIPAMTRATPDWIIAPADTDPAFVAGRCNAAPFSVAGTIFGRYCRRNAGMEIVGLALLTGDMVGSPSKRLSSTGWGGTGRNMISPEIVLGHADPFHDALAKYHCPKNRNDVTDQIVQVDEPIYVLLHLTADAGISGAVTLMWEGTGFLDD